MVSFSISLSFGFFFFFWFSAPCATCASYYLKLNNCRVDEDSRNSAPPVLFSEHSAAPLPRSPPSANFRPRQSTQKGGRDNSELDSGFLGRSLAQTTQQPIPESQTASVQYSYPDTLVYPLDMSRSSSGLEMPKALAPSMFHNIPASSPAPPSTPSSGPSSSAMQNSPLEERSRSFLQRHTDMASPAAQAPQYTQSPLPGSSRLSLTRKPTPLAQRRSRRASAAQNQLSGDTSTPDSGVDVEPEASSSTAGSQKPRGLGARTSIGGKPPMPSTLVRTSQLSSRKAPRDPVRLLIKGDLNNMALGWYV